MYQYVYCVVLSYMSYIVPQFDLMIKFNPRISNALGFGDIFDE